jgi:SAM-dependent methyltransferase
MNKDEKVINDFGEEWCKFEHGKIDKKKLFINFQQYFSIFPWSKLSNESIGFDMGCGSGRWAQFIAPKVKILNCVEPSKAINVAKKNLKDLDNVRFYNETTEKCSIKLSSQDFGYCLGVLHHIPNTQNALADCASLLKSGAPFLLYLYYNFENKPLWFKLIWKISDIIRKIVSRLPQTIKRFISEAIALFIYFPLSRIALLFEKMKLNPSNIPLSDYRKKPFYQMRNDALDRFGTRLEQRFSKRKIEIMLFETGFEHIKFSNKTPYWCCVAYKK